MGFRLSLHDSQGGRRENDEPGLAGLVAGLVMGEDGYTRSEVYILSSEVCHFRRSCPGFMEQDQEKPE